MQHCRRPSLLFRRRVIAVMLASAGMGHSVTAQSPSPANRPAGPSSQVAAPNASASASVELFAPTNSKKSSNSQPVSDATESKAPASNVAGEPNSKVEIRVARRPWLLEKLTGPKKEPSVKMNPPRPPADIPDPPSMSRIRPQPNSDGPWVRRRADGDYEQALADEKRDAEKKVEPQTVDSKNRLRPKSEQKPDDRPVAKDGGDERKPTTSVPQYAQDKSAQSTDDSESASTTRSQASGQPKDKSVSRTPDRIGTTKPAPPKATEAESKSAASISKPKPDAGASQYIESGEDEAAVPLDYTGYPRTEMRMTNSVYRMRNSIRQCLRYYYGRPESANERSNWGMLHSIMVYGADTRILAGNRSYSAIAWIAGNNACRGQRLLVEQDGRIVARSGVGLQGHQAQMLAVLSLCDVPADYPLYAGDNRYTVQDLVESEMLACKSGEELTFTLIGLAHYLDTSAVWTNAQGETWDFERLIREELSQPIVGAACGGTHRLMGYAHALRKRRAEGRPITGQWKRAEIYTRDFINYAYRLQNRDGSMTTDWFEGREDNGDIDRKIQTTGHIVEWLLTVTPDSQLQNPRLVSAVRFLLRSMYNERGHDWKIGPKGHALRSLAMYYERAYRSGTAWSVRSMAQSQGTPNR